MTASQAFDNLLGKVQASHLNFKIELSPFSAVIHVKKSFIKNRFGQAVVPVVEGPLEAQGVHDKKVVELEKENDMLKVKIEEKVKEAENCHGMVYKLEKEIKTKENILNCLKKEMKEKEIYLQNLVVENRDLKADKKSISSELHNIKFKLMGQYENAKHDGEVHDDLKNENDKLKIKSNEIESELDLKTQENRELRDSLNVLESENSKLKDVLFGGCPQCGLDCCECSDGDTNYSPLPPQLSSSPDTVGSAFTSSSKFPAAQHHAQASSGTCPSPPPTPPCSRCGGINYGPCPSSLCFGCVPALESQCSSNTSLSNTPPGTPPPLLKLETVRRKNEAYNNQYEQ